MKRPAWGQGGRYRGEMRRESLLWESVRSGARDPRSCFPTLEEFLEALRGAIGYLQQEQIESSVYGKWVPQELYGAEAKANGMPLVAGLERYSLPVAAERKLQRGGMVTVAAETIFEGHRHQYAFATAEGWRWDGAPVIVRFDPRTAAERGASLELAKPWKDSPAGMVIDGAAQCVSPAPDFVSATGFVDVRRAAGATKRAARAATRSVVAAYDQRGEIAARQRTEEGAASGSIRGGTLAEPKQRRAAPVRSEEEWEAMEAAAGLTA